MFKPVEVKALPNYRIWLRYADGVEGDVDLSTFAGKGVFQAWNDYSFFEDVQIGEHDQVSWSEEIDMCPDALYLQITGKRPEEVFPSLREAGVNA